MRVEIGGCLVLININKERMVDDLSLTISSPKMAWLSSGKDSPNMVSLEKIGAESYKGTFKSVYEM